MDFDCMEDLGPESYLEARFAAGLCPKCSRGIAYHSAVPFFGGYELQCHADPVRTAPNDDGSLPSIQELVAKGALFVCNHSGGKDSQAMLARLRLVVPEKQLVVIHAHLPDVEWQGTWEHVQQTSAGLPTYMVQAEKTFLGMVEKRGEVLRAQGKADTSPWPSPQFRQCTSDLKRGPIEKKIRAICRERGVTTIVNCMGLRAEESAARRKQKAFRWNAGNSIGGRTWYDWLPIHDLTVEQVFAIIREAGQEPHWAYSKGMTRLSCVFCIMASQRDLETAAGLRRDLLARYVHLERKLGHSMLMPSKKHGKRYLDEVTGVAVPEGDKLLPAAA